MSAEAAKEWFDLAKSDIKRVQTVFAGLGIFIAVLGYTLAFQRSQLRENKADLQGISDVVKHRWDGLGVVYSQAPFESYYEGHLRPWYLLCLAARERNKVLLGLHPAKPKLTEDAIARIDSALQYLGEHNSNIQTMISARKFNTKFEELDGRKLKRLIDLIDFEPKENEEGIKLGMAEAQTSAFGFLAIDSADEQSLVRPPFGFAPDVAHALKKNLKLPGDIVEIFKKGADLERFKTFHVEMEVQDTKEFGAKQLTDQDKSEMLSDLAAGKVTTLAQLYAREAQLTQKINSLQGNSITEGPEISIPFLAIAIPLSLFGLIGGFLNLVLIGYLLRLLARIRDSLAEVRRLSGSYEPESLRAVTSALPFARANHFGAIAAQLMILVMPSLLTAVLLIINGRLRFFPLCISTLTIISASVLAYLFATKTRRISELAFK